MIESFELTVMLFSSVNFVNVYYSPWWQGTTPKLYEYEEYWILKAFEWNRTPQGYDFWKKLNSKWNVYLSDNINS